MAASRYLFPFEELCQFISAILSNCASSKGQYRHSLSTLFSKAKQIETSNIEEI
jgi:hypothetical protein